MLKHHALCILGYHCHPDCPIAKEGEKQLPEFKGEESVRIEYIGGGILLLEGSKNAIRASVADIQSAIREGYLKEEEERKAKNNAQK